MAHTESEGKRVELGDPTTQTPRPTHEPAAALIYGWCEASGGGREAPTPQHGQTDAAALFVSTHSPGVRRREAWDCLQNASGPWSSQKSLPFPCLPPSTTPSPPPFPSSRYADMWANLRQWAVHGAVRCGWLQGGWRCPLIFRARRTDLFASPRAPRPHARCRWPWRLPHWPSITDAHPPSLSQTHFSHQHALHYARFALPFGAAATAGRARGVRLGRCHLHVLQATV